MRFYDSTALFCSSLVSSCLSSVACPMVECCRVDDTSPERAVTGLSPSWVDPDVDWLYISISHPQPAGTRASTPQCENLRLLQRASVCQQTMKRNSERLQSKKIKVVHTRLPSVGFRSWSRFLAVSLQVTWVINPAVGCHYFPPGSQLPPQPLRSFAAWWTIWVWTVCLRRFSDSVAAAIWTQHANHSATGPPTTIYLDIRMVTTCLWQLLCQIPWHFDRTFMGKFLQME